MNDVPSRMLCQQPVPHVTAGRGAEFVCTMSSPQNASRSALSASPATLSDRANRRYRGNAREGEGKSLRCRARMLPVKEYGSTKVLRQGPENSFLRRGDLP